MTLRTSLRRLTRRDPAAPTLRERGAALKAGIARVIRRPEPEASADQGRRAVMGGALAAAVPLPALAAPPVEAPAQPHPDAALLAAGERYERALSVQASTGAAYDAAWEPMRALLETCPPDLIVSWSDRNAILGGMRWPTAVGGNLRGIPPDEDGVHREAWTGKVLRNAIRFAVPLMGRGGQTPHRVRRWTALLPIADAFDERADAIDRDTDLPACRRAYYASREEVWEAARALDNFTAATPEGLAFVVRIAALDRARGCFPAPNLIQSAANVAGIDLLTVATPRPGTYG